VGTTIRALVVVVAFLVALVAVAFGLRRLRAPARSGSGLAAAARKAFWSAAAVLLGTIPGCGGGDGGGSGEDQSDEVSCYRFDRVEHEDAEDGGAEAQADTPDVSAEADSEAMVDVPLGPDADADAEIGPEDGRDEGAWAECYVAVEEFLEADGGADEGAAGEADAIEPEASPEAASDAPDVFEPDGMTCYQVGPPDVASRSLDRRLQRALARASAVRGLLLDPATHHAVREIVRRDLRALDRRIARLRRPG
jgi:hypothetical protein